MIDEEKLEDIEADIARLRRLGTKEAIESADKLELRLVLHRNKLERVEQLTLDRVAEWMNQLRADLRNKRLDAEDIDAWPEHLADDALQALEVAYSACLFRVRPTAQMLGFEQKVVAKWMKSRAWSDFLRDKTRRIHQISALADLAVGRLSHILAIDTNNIETMKLQAGAARTVLTAGLRVPDEVPRDERTAQKPQSHMNSSSRVLGSAAREQMVSTRVRATVKK